MWVADRQSSGEMVEQTSPRAYIVQIPDGLFKRDRRHIVATPQGEPSRELELPTMDNASPRSPIPVMLEEQKGTPKVYPLRSRTRIAVDPPASPTPVTLKIYPLRSRNKHPPTDGES